LVNSGQTQWDFLVSLAKRIGYTLFCSGTEISCHRRDLSLRDRGGSALVLRRAANGLGEIRSFRAIIGAAGSDQVDPGDREGFTVDMLSSRVVPVSARGADDSSFSQFADISASSYGEARTILEGERERGRWTQRAEVETRGDPRVSQGATVLLAGVGSEHEGLWYVSEVEHVIRGGSYDVSLVALRDDSSPRGEVSVPGRRVIRERFDTHEHRKDSAPRTILMGSTWRSAHSRARVASADRELV
jgi:hypothetical protein